MSAHLRVILLSWLLIAPAVSNTLQLSGGLILFQREVEEAKYAASRQDSAYLTYDATITLGELFEPTRILFAGAFILLLLPALLKRPVTGLDRTETWMLLFSVILVANVVSQSWRVTYGLRVATDAFIMPFVGYAVMRRLITTEESVRQLVRILAYIGSYVIVIAIFDRLSHEELTYRIQGPFRSNQTLQVVLAVAFFAVWSERSRMSAVSGLKSGLGYVSRQIVLLLTFPVIFLTWSRGNWAGSLTAACIYLLLGRSLIHPMHRFRGIGFLLLLLPILTIIAAGLETTDAPLTRISNVKTIESRLVTWTRLVQEAVDDPVFGMGLNNLRNYLAQDWRLLGTVHNGYLSIFIELGASGLLTYMMIIGSVIRRGFRLARMAGEAAAQWRGAAIVAVIIAQQIPSLFANNLYLTEMGHLLVFAFIGSVVGRYQQQYRLPAKHLALQTDDERITNEAPRSFV